MAGGRSKTVMLKLLSTAGTGTFFIVKKNRTRFANHKLAFRKFDPKVGQHVLFKEAKLK